MFSACPKNIICYVYWSVPSALLKLNPAGHRTGLVTGHCFWTHWNVPPRQQPCPELFLSTFGLVPEPCTQPQLFICTPTSLLLLTHGQALGKPRKWAPRVHLVSCAYSEKVWKRNQLLRFSINRYLSLYFSSLLRGHLQLTEQNWLMPRRHPRNESKGHRKKQCKYK